MRLLRFLGKLAGLYVLYAVALLGAAVLIVLFGRTAPGGGGALVVITIAALVALFFYAAPLVEEARSRTRAGDRTGFRHREAGARPGTDSIRTILIAIPLMILVAQVAPYLDAAHERQIKAERRYSATATSAYPVPYDGRISRSTSATFFVMRRDRLLHQFLVNLTMFLHVSVVLGALVVIYDRMRGPPPSGQA